MATIKSYTDKPKRKPYFKHNIVYCKKGNIVDEYQSIVEAAKTNRILHTSIVNNLKGRSKTCGGFIYEYKQN